MSQLWVTSVCVVGVTVVGDVCLAGEVSYSLKVAVGVAAPSGGVLLLDSVNYSHKITVFHKDQHLNWY